MTLTLSLKPEQEQRLREAAKARGLDADTLASELFQNALDQFPIPSEPPTQRVLGLQAAGISWIAEDFDAPLPDSFWLGEEE